jgi:hypothetical protein
VRVSGYFTPVVGDPSSSSSTVPIQARSENGLTR